MKKLLFLSMMCLIALTMQAQQPTKQGKTGEPYVVLDYLTVYPSDLGTFDSEPRSTIAKVNQMQQYGYGTWRLPTNEEISLMRGRGLIGKGKYMTKETRNEKGIVRLVTDKKKGEVITKVVPDGYVDLGLPSGTLWKVENEESGCKYDVAMLKYNESLPTKEQFEELIKYCNWSWVEGHDDGWGTRYSKRPSEYTVTGPSGRSIILKCSMYVDCYGHYQGSVFVNGYYWTSTPNGVDGAYACSFASGVREGNVLAIPAHASFTGQDLYSKGPVPFSDLGIITAPRCMGYSIRLVYNP